MNSFINKVLKWLKKSSFGLILTSFAIVLVVSVGLIIDTGDDVTVNKPTDSFTSISHSENYESESSSNQYVEIEKIKLPFLVDATIARYYFDSSDSLEIKSQALVNYENKFTPSLGMCYTFNNTPFNVTNSFEGVVVKKTNDSLYGLSVVIENKDGLRAHYCGLSDLSIKVNETIKQGQVIGKSGENIINASLGNHLYFALQYQDDFINPLKAFDKPVSEVINN